MATRNVKMQDTWTVEPELTEQPPRRIMRSDFPDLNQPNAVLFYSIGGVAGLAGIILLIMGLTSNPANTLFAILGVVLMLAGAGLAGFVPTLVNKHIARTEQLAIHGIPVMARIIASDNLSGDSQNARLVKYQVTMPGGELISRQVHADDRLLPVSIPGYATALINIDSGDVELYCALPFRAIGKGGPAGSRSPAAAPDPLADLPVAPTTPAPVPSTSMNTLNVENFQPVRAKTAEPAPAAATDSGSHPKPAKADSTTQPKQGMASLEGVTPVVHEKPAVTAPAAPVEHAPVATTTAPPYETDEPEPEAGPPQLQPMVAVTDEDEAPPKADTDEKKDARSKAASGLPWE